MRWGWIRATVGAAGFRHAYMFRSIRRFSGRLPLRALILLLIAAALTLSGCGLFGGDDAPATAPAPPPASDDPQPTQQPAAQQPAQTPQQARDPQPVSTTQQSQAAEQQPAAEEPQQQAAAETPAAAAAEYVVQPGDTLAAIAAAHDVRLDDLIRVNNIQNPNVLSVGQRLLIPGDEPEAVVAEPAGSDEAAAVDSGDAQAEESVDTPTVTLPNTAVALATPTTTSASQFPQPGPDATVTNLPNPPASFIQYGADLLPWMHGRTIVDEIVPVFYAWPMPNTAVALATPTTTSASQFPQPGPDATVTNLPNPPASFIQYGADLLPWMHGRTIVDEIVPVFYAWPMPPLIEGDSRVNLVDTNGDGLFSAAIIFTDPNSFGAAVPFSNLVVYDPIPGRADRYRIGYDHRLAYGREVQGLQVLSDLDLTGDGIRDVTFREVSCSGGVCANAFYVLRGVGDGYVVVTGAEAQINDVETVEVADGTADGVLDLVVAGIAADDGQPYRFTLSVQAGALVEVSRIARGG